MVLIAKYLQCYGLAVSVQRVINVCHVIMKEPRTSLCLATSLLKYFPELIEFNEEDVL